MWPGLHRGGGGGTGNAHGLGRPGRGPSPPKGGGGARGREGPGQRSPGRLGRSARGLTYASKGSGVRRAHHTSRGTRPLRPAPVLAKPQATHVPFTPGAL